LVQRYKVHPNKIQVIYNPVDLDHIREHVAKGQIATEHQPIFSGDTKVIVTAGRLVQDKDQQTLIQAVAKVQKRLPVDLVILGEGELEATLKQQAKDLEIENHVHFIGFQSNPYIYFEQADVFVLSSLREGFGHVLVEALATGTPVVSTNCKPGAEEVLNGGEFGKLCEVGNATDMAAAIIDVLTRNQEETEEIIQKGKQRAEQFAAKRIVKQYESVFQQTIDEGKRNRKRRGETMNTPTRVVHLTTVHHPYDPRIYHKECQSLQKAGYDVTLIAQQSEGESRKNPPIKHIPIKTYASRFKRMLFGTWDTYQKAKKLQADVYHFHDPELMFVGWLLKKNDNVVVYDIHEDYVTSILQKEYMKKPVKKMIAVMYKLLEKFFTRHMELCLAEKYYKEIYKRGTC